MKKKNNNEMNTQALQKQFLLYTHTYSLKDTIVWPAWAMVCLDSVWRFLVDGQQIVCKRCLRTSFAGT